MINIPCRRAKTHASAMTQTTIRTLMRKHGIQGAAGLLHAAEGTLQQLASGGAVMPATLERLEAKLTELSCSP
jgi:protein-disulfide isomerase-like protein with CxxC motif